MGKVVGGGLEFYADPECPAFNYILHNALGGDITTATATGETASGLGFEHTIEIGNISDQTYTGLSFNIRRGDSTNGKVTEYVGGRVNEITFSAELDEPLKVSTDFVFKDSTNTTNNIESSLTGFQTTNLSFIGGRLSVETSFASLTASSYWHCSGFNLKISNNLKTDSESRRIGSDTLDVLPSGIATIELSATIRFDTTTSYDAMISGTQLSGQLEFEGDTMAGSIIKRGLLFNMPVLYVKDAGHPEISGPDGLLTSEVVFNVLRDASSAGGYALETLVTNLVSSYD
jgi:hypothetical protein